MPLIATALAALLCPGGVRTADAAPFSTGAFVTYSQGAWGDENNAVVGALLAFNFFTVYPSGALEVGIIGPAGWSIGFSDPLEVIVYLPQGGGIEPLTTDLINPHSSPSGAFGGEVVALELNVDYSDAGVLTGTSGFRFGDLVLAEMASYGSGLPQADGLTVRQLLRAMNIQLGGGALFGEVYEVHDLAHDLNRAFETSTLTPGGVSPFAQNHLLIPGESVPEPATSALFGLGLSVLMGRSLTAWTRHRARTHTFGRRSCPTSRRCTDARPADM